MSNKTEKVNIADMTFSYPELEIFLVALISLICCPTCLGNCQVAKASTWCFDEVFRQAHEIVLESLCTCHPFPSVNVVLKWCQLDAIWNTLFSSKNIACQFCPSQKTNTLRYFKDSDVHQNSCARFHSFHRVAIIFETTFESHSSQVQALCWWLTSTEGQYV